MSIRVHAARLNLGARITLFDVDLTDLGGGVQRFAPMNEIIGMGGYTRLGSNNGNVPINIPLAANTARAVYIRLIIRRETGNLWFNTLGFRSGSLTSYKAFDPNHAKNLAGVNRAVSAGMNQIQYVATVATGGYLIIGASIVVSGTNWIDTLVLNPGVGNWSNSNWSTHANNTTGRKMDVVSLEVWTEPTLNNLQIEMKDPAYPRPTGITITKFEGEQDILPVRWRGNDYQPLPIMAEGFDVVGQGPYPRPRLRMVNALGLGTTLTKQFNDLLGAKITRWRTFDRYLDRGITPDQNAHLPVDIYFVDLKTRHTKAEIEWELASILDQKGVLLPGRQVMRHGCQLQYRVWNGSGFSYSNVSCPYAGTKYFDQQDNPTTAANDMCSHQLSGCLKRFTSGPVPFGGFPMVGRISR